MKTESIRRVAVIGLGTIGMRWAAVFSHAGLDVVAQDPDPAAWERWSAQRDTLLNELQQLLPREGEPGNVTFTVSVEEAVKSADFIQENAPEKLELKRALLAEIDAAAPEYAIISSSSSALHVSDFQIECAKPERVVLGHPFNPVHLMPLVEVVGGKLTAPECVAAAAAFYESIGKKPVVMRRELTGHLALRLMGAMWREAIALVLEGSVSAEDVDRAFRYGPGPKWTLQGSFISNHLGANGMEEFLEKYGSTYEAIWQDLRSTPVLNPEVRAHIAAETNAAIGGRSNDSLLSQRDAGLMQMLQIQQQFGA